MSPVRDTEKTHKMIKNSYFHKSLSVNDIERKTSDKIYYVYISWHRLARLSLGFADGAWGGRISPVLRPPLFYCLNREKQGRG